jgi:sterol desaturase/sphingolipid hydroxylase (fatty acid hydroxylase superfamily)
MKERFVRFRSFWIFPFLAVILLTISAEAEPDRTATELFALIPVGVILWSLLEYGLHRFVFHRDRTDTFIGRIVTGSHLSHHGSPRDPDKVLVHTSFALPVSVVLFSVLYGITGSFFQASGVMSGIWAGFLYYELVHYRVHCTASGFLLMRRQRRAHFHHHFSDSSRCFGVTSPLWDAVFGTRATFR